MQTGKHENKKNGKPHAALSFQKHERRFSDPDQENGVYVLSVSLRWHDPGQVPACFTQAKGMISVPGFSPGHP